MNKLLEERAPKNWRKFDSFLDIFFVFMVNSADEVAQDKEGYDSQSEAFKVGIEIFFIQKMIQKLGDFILQENSPYFEPG